MIGFLVRASRFQFFLLSAIRIAVQRRKRKREALRQAHLAHEITRKRKLNAYHAGICVMCEQAPSMDRCGFCSACGIERTPAT